MKVGVAGIYTITHIASGRCYVGSSIDIANRIRIHQRDLNRNAHHSAKLQRAWNKYGADAFSFSTLEVIEDVAILIAREQYWIDEMKAASRSNFNVAPKAGNCLGLRHSDESREKMSKARAGKKKSPEHVAKVAAANRGKRRSAELKSLLSEVHKGRKHTDESRANMKAGQAKRVMSDQARERMVTANIGRKFSDEHRAKIGEAQKSRRMTDQQKKNLSETMQRLSREQKLPGQANYVKAK